MKAHSSVLQELQRSKCSQYSTSPDYPAPGTKLGISLSVRDGILPIHGLRLQPEGGTCGWYIWAGEFSEAEDFFKPLHVTHLRDWCPAVLPFLALPPGWRFLTDADYEDVWFDQANIR